MSIIFIKILFMHSIQQKILELSKSEDLGKLSLRKIAEIIDEKSSPQKIKHHIDQLKKKWLIRINKIKWTMERVKSWFDNISSMFSIPILGSANCWEAIAIVDDWPVEWYLKVSKKLLWLNREKGFFALKAVWHSMNMIKLWFEKKSIEDWDYVIVDSSLTNYKNWDVIVSIIDWCANIKKLIFDKDNHQVVLMSDSSLDFPPIYIHEDDDYVVNGKVIQVIKKPKGV